MYYLKVFENVGDHGPAPHKVAPPLVSKPLLELQQGHDRAPGGVIGCPACFEGDTLMWGLACIEGNISKAMTSFIIIF